MFKYLFLLFTFCFVVSLFSIPAFANDVFSGSVSVSDGSEEATKLISTMKYFANVFAAVVLAISIVVFVHAGWVYIFAGFELNGRFSYADNILKFRIIYAGIGIVIALSAYGLGRLFDMFTF